MTNTSRLYTAIDRSPLVLTQTSVTTTITFGKRRTNATRTSEEANADYHPSEAHTTGMHYSVVFTTYSRANSWTYTSITGQKVNAQQCGLGSCLGQGNRASAADY